MSAAAAPLVAFGPPGWVALGVITVGTAGVMIWQATRNRSSDRAVPRAEPRAVPQPCQDCQRPWSVRVHAQGTDVGGTTGSTVGAPPIVKRSGPVTTGEGVGLAGATYALLTRRQQGNLAGAYERCLQFIRARPANGGFLGSRSFYGASRDNNRFDVDSYGPSPNFVS